MIIFKEVSVKTQKRENLMELTGQIQELVDESDIKEGVCRLYVPHTTAGITINENADPSVEKDLINHMRKVIPQSADFSHSEENSDAHIKSSLTGISTSVLIHDGQLMLGTWQGIFFVEWDGPRHRKLFVQIHGET
jgi:secondary thiamine-phosphate synthase enzyme